MPIIWIITYFLDRRRARREARRLEAQTQAQDQARARSVNQTQPASTIPTTLLQSSRPDVNNAAASGSGAVRDHGGSLLPANESRAHLLSSSSVEVDKQRG